MQYSIKFSKFIHKTLRNSSAIEPALAIAEALYCASGNRVMIGRGFLPRMDGGMDAYFNQNTPEFSDIQDAFEVANRVETHIEPRTSCYVNSAYPIEVHIRFYRPGEKAPIYRLSAGLSEDRLVFQTREADVEFIRRSNIISHEKLAKAHVLPSSNREVFDVGLSGVEILRVQYAGTINDHPPRGGDFFRIQLLRERQVVSSLRILASPCYQYLVDIGHGLVLYPHGKGIEKAMPYQPVMLRCREWALQRFDASAWPEGVPIKQAEQLKAA